jgi:hypothetical protein
MPTRSITINKILNKNIFQFIMEKKDMNLDKNNFFSVINILLENKYIKSNFLM